MSDAVVILPYVFENEVQTLINKLNESFIEYIIEPDIDKIGPDLMYQKLWKKTDKDIIILHSDMLPMEEDQDNQWHTDLCNYAAQYPEAGILGCKLLYPAKHDGKFIIQHAGGKFREDGTPDHFGSGYDIASGRVLKDNLELDIGQYDYVREVAWATFGGIYMRRTMLNDVGDFDPNFEWSYNRDVDYCLTARSKGYKIYQIPVPLLHFESRDVKRIRTEEMVNKELRNLLKLKTKWTGSELYKTIDKKVINDN
jgi:GT2 family glycosyltransferase